MGMFTKGEIAEDSSREPTAETLMRSRYSAFVQCRGDYLRRKLAAINAVLVTPTLHW